METGSNKSLFTLIAVILFGVFLSLSYWLFKDELVNVLASVMDSTSEMTNKKLDNNGLIPTDAKYFTTVLNADNTIKLTNYDTSGGTDIIIPAFIDNKAVTTIGSTAFQGKGLTSIVIPSTVVKIEDGTGYFNPTTKVDSRIGAFSDNKLKSLTIPDSVTYIGFWAFAKNQISDLNLGSSLEKIGVYSFYNNKIRTLTLPDSMRVLSGGSFEYNHIDTINFNEGLTTISDWSFGSGVGNITSVKIPSTVTTIGTYAFVYSESITELTLPKSLESKFNTPKMVHSYTQDPITNLINSTKYFDVSYFNFY